MIKKIVILGFVFSVMFSSTAFAADAMVWVKAPNKRASSMVLKNIKTKHRDGTIDDTVVMIGADGSKLIIPFSSLEGIYIRKNNIMLVKTRTGVEHKLQIDPTRPSLFVGKNNIGGTTSFTTNYFTYLKFR